ncbi:AMP-binding protein [Crossiella cryophila]|uniref:Cyclohexanecarboxylate-CoA ligase n=1 Tax=Crossiella cryophila TaxID=43355 RepID=A0A7W7C979_9PSEU|nr:AMP-binding protein [Crossiella cryophila]MBB4676889.1 cyclohexanecarboxylate-CoA ligase [Crossiella cryophila]
MAIPRISAPDRELANHYRALGVWRETTVLSDLRRAVAEFPERRAIVAQVAGQPEPVCLTYRELHRQVFRFADALRARGVGPGAVVSFQLPNRWENAALTLACAALGAIAAPIMASMGPRERARFQQWTGARTCVLAEDLPFFLDGDWAGVDDGSEDDPDRVFLVLFTSGTTGEPKGVLHSHNTLHANLVSFAAEEDLGEPVVSVTPHSLSRIAGLGFGVLLPLLRGGTALYQDEWDPAGLHRLISAQGATVLAAAPPFIAALLAAHRAEPLPLSWRCVMAGGMPIPRQLPGEVAEQFGLPLRALWAMTEGGFSWTRADDPADAATNSDGRFGPHLEFELAPGAHEDESRLFIRGAAVALATLDTGSGAVRVLAEHGWYDTGDLARADGRGGIRVTGRSVDRIGGISMILVKEVEDELAGHPAVDQVALVGYSDRFQGELACAVVVPAGPPPTLSQLRAYLTERGMTEWYQPHRLELVAELPRNEMGKVRKNLLRERIAAADQTFHPGM